MLRTEDCSLNAQPVSAGFNVHRTGSAVEAALGLVETGPATGAGVLAVADRTGARPAADRRVAALDERVHGQVPVLDVALHVEVGPRREWLDLHEALPDVVRDDRRVGPACVLVAAQPRHPRGPAAQRPLERLDLAHPAALVRVAVPEVFERGL